MELFSVQYCTSKKVDCVKARVIILSVCMIGLTLMMPLLLSLRNKLITTPNVDDAPPSFFAKQAHHNTLGNDRVKTLNCGP